MFIVLLMWEPNFIHTPKKLKFKVQPYPLPFWIVNILSYLFSLSLALTSEDEACVSCPITRKSCLFKLLHSPSFSISCTWSTETISIVWGPVLTCKVGQLLHLLLKLTACTDLLAVTLPAKGSAASLAMREKYRPCRLHNKDCGL